MSKDKHTINCDQVSWLLRMAERYIPEDDHPVISQARDMRCLAMVYEIIDIMGTDFEDEAALYNATPGFITAWKERRAEDVLRGCSSEELN